MSVLTGHEFVAPKQEPPFEDDEESWELIRKSVERVKELVFPIFELDTNG